MGDPILDVIEVLPLVSLRDVESFGISDISRVLVQGLRNKAYVPLFESPVRLADEFYLWGIGALCVRHWDEAIEGGVPL